MSVRNARQWLEFWGTVLLSVGLLTACSSDSAGNAAPKDFSEGDACVLDGMYLADFPGPKGQLIFADGRVAWFCDTVELLHTLLAQETVKSIAGAFVQDMAKADWERPRGQWIEARSAFYVFGSSRLGSMGPTAVSFANRADAEAFARKYGGAVKTFAEVTAEDVRLDGAALHDDKM
ncbi:nitrous oxide reductase accessory protein NosL [Hydrogenophilus thiooxidans]|uniref:nitrous oxide reductase accessory protein NosL n=1 Tax=Hydrogenophilus thiooxidans TaxID=2820326 RepID=UPI001C24B112|nr:nitrous oxide reductase accessory protein NosL [Hydrogenophilus thiooxidans]